MLLSFTQKQLFFRGKSSNTSELVKCHRSEVHIINPL